jgi:hypothetical protein
LLDANARIVVRKNTGADVGTRRRVNLVEGANISLTVTDDAGSEEIDVTIAATSGGAITAKDEGTDLTVALASLNFVGTAIAATAVGNAVTVTSNLVAPLAHQASHQSGGSDALTGLVDATARTTIRKNTGADVGSRRRLNLIEGANIAITATDDAGSEEVDITVAVTGSVTPAAHQTSHQSGGSDALTGNLDATSRVNVSRNSGATLATRRRLNFIEGTNITISVADDAGNEEADITITGATPPTITVKDEGANLTTAVTSIDFVGAGVTATGGAAVTVTIPGGGAGSLTGVTALVDTGAGAAQSKTVTVTDATVSGTSKLILGWGNVLDTDENSPEFDNVSFFAAPAAGSFLLRISATDRWDAVQGKYRINYLVAA